MNLSEFKGILKCHNDNNYSNKAALLSVNVRCTDNIANLNYLKFNYFYQLLEFALVYSHVHTAYGKQLIWGTQS